MKQSTLNYESLKAEFEAKKRELNKKHWKNKGLKITVNK